MRQITDIGYITAVDELSNIDAALEDMADDFDEIISELRNDARQCNKLGINNKFLQIRSDAQKLRQEFYEFRQHFKKLNNTIINQCAEVQGAQFR